MTFSRFQDTADDTSDDEPTDSRVFPRLRPVEGGDVEFQHRIRGHLHLLEDEGALAYGREKTIRFNKYKGYGISVDILECLSDKAAELREAGVVPETAEVEYIFFFLPEEREVLQFTLDQYLNAEHEFTNYGQNGTDKQHIVEESDAIRSWSNGYDYVFRDTEVVHGYSSVE